VLALLLLPTFKPDFRLSHHLALNL